jgi:hypothetical protein
MIDMRTIGSRRGLINGSSSQLLFGVFAITPMLVGIIDAIRAMGCLAREPLDLEQSLCSVVRTLVLGCGRSTRVKSRQ